MKIAIRVHRRAGVSALALGILAFGVTAQAEPADNHKIEWVAKSATGNVISGLGTNDLVLSAGGVEVSFDIMVSGWGNVAGAPRLNAFNAGLIGYGMLGVNASPSNPGADLETETKVECGSDGDCSSGFCGLHEPGVCDVNQAGFIIAKVCMTTTSQHCITQAQCPGGEFCVENPEFVLSGETSMAAVALSSPARRWEWIGVATSGGKTDPGYPMYAGTLKFVVPAAAAGTYTLGFNHSDEVTFFNDQNSLKIPGLLIQAGTVSVQIGRCCYWLGTPGEGCVDAVKDSVCTAQYPAPRIWEAGALCPASGGGPCAECITDNDCKDPTSYQVGNDNKCTLDECTAISTCTHSDLYDAAVNCCDPDVGVPDGLTLIDDFDSCTADSCFEGAAVHDPVPCCYGGACELLSIEEDCASLGGVCVRECLGDGDGNGVDDACEGDCDGDGILDVNEADSAEDDCDDDGICDGVEMANCPPGDPSCDDCQSNGIPDGCEIADETGMDCNSNGVPDECELADGSGEDCNLTGVLDECDIADATSDDCNSDGIPDECEIDENSAAGGGPFYCTLGCDPDCNENGIPDACDIKDDTSDDCNTNGVPDECDIAEGESPDCNENGVPDTCDILEATSPDCNTNRTPDECEIDVNSTAGGGPYFCTVNCDPDCNNNGVPDACELADDPSLDCDGNGTLDECEPWACCLDNGDDGVYEGCMYFLEDYCVGAGGIFRGPCYRCPEQDAERIVEPGGEVFWHLIDAPVDCLGQTDGGLRRSCPPGAPKIDAWKSDADAQMCQNFGVTDSPAIPADFFCPQSNPTCGSEEWAGSVCLEGVSLDDPLFLNADTLISRSADPFDRCEIVPLPTTAAPVEIEVIALSLKSVGPITVTYDGQNEELWSVAVDLSTFVTDPPLPKGTLTATKTHCNGGTYTSVLHVQARFTFTKVGSNPPEVRVLDTGEAGIPYVTLDQQDPVSWVADIDPSFGVTSDPCSDFHPGIDDLVHVTDCDCNANQVRDGCDIAFDGPDCNQNAVPDECEIDENSPASGGPFFCTTGCDPDCNVNGVPDQCDLAPPEAVPGPYDMRKNRFLAFSPGDNGCVAIRVELLDRACSASGEPCSYDADCPIDETCEDLSAPAPIGWVGEPCQIPADTQVPPDTMASLVVREMPLVQVFPDMVFVTDCEIQPRRGYALSATTDGIVFSERFVIATIREPFKNAKHWADVVGQRDAGTGEYTEPNQRINVDDVQVMIVFLNGKSYRPHLTVLDLSHEVPGFKINADDLQMVLRAFNITEDYPPLKFRVEASGAAHPWHCPYDSADARHDKCE